MLQEHNTGDYRNLFPIVVCMNLGLPVITSVSHNQSYVKNRNNEVSRQDWKKGWGPVGLSRGDQPTSTTLAGIVAVNLKGLFQCILAESRMLLMEH